MKRDANAIPEAKRATRKKVVVGDLSLLKKSSKSKPVTKKVIDKELTKVNTKTKRVAKKTTVTKLKSLPGVIVDKNDEEKDVVSMPTSASLRVLEKIQLYKAWYQLDFPYLVSDVAKKSGYALIFVGVFLALGIHLSNTFDNKNVAATVCAGDFNCVEVPDEDIPNIVPKVEFLNSLPEVLKTDVDITIRSAHNFEPILSAFNLNSGESVVLNPEDKISNGEFRYLLKPQSFKSGLYELRAKIDDGENTYIFKGSIFSISGSDIVRDFAVPPIVKIGDVEATSSTTTNNFIDEPNLLDAPITLRINQTNSADFVKIEAGNLLPPKVSLYAFDVGLNKILFLGLATRVTDGWVFNLSALDLPNTDLRIYADFEVQGKTYYTNSVPYLSSTKGGVKLATADDIKILVNKISLALETSAVDNEKRKVYWDVVASSTKDIFIETDELTVVGTDVVDEAWKFLEENKSILNDLLFNYALMSQSNSFFLRDKAELILRDFVHDELIKYGNESNRTSLTAILDGRITALLNVVREHEDGISEVTNELTAKDTDFDGLSDFDELANIGTDPALADTNNNGVIDSIEFLYRWDNKNKNTTANNIGVDNIIEIKRVTGLNLETVNGLKTFANIIGKGLPNSFVFIKLSTENVWAVAKTASDGMFYHTFEKELADGDYSVFAGYLNQSGGLVIKSNEYKFTKNHENLVAAVLFTESSTLNSSETNSNVPYIVSATILLVVFGFVLILLGESVIARRRVQIKNV